MLAEGLPKNRVFPSDSELAARNTGLRGPSEAELYKALPDERREGL